MRRRDGLTLHHLEERFEPVPVTGRRGRSFLGFLAVPLLASIGLCAAGLPATGAAINGAHHVIQMWNELPADTPTEEALPQHTILLDKDGKEFGRFYSENRIDVTLAHISPHLIDALLATEDSRFRDHQGIDGVGLVRAAVSNFTGGGRQGASTITQQLVQNILISNARDETEQQVAIGNKIPDKLREIRYALELENKLTKDQILEMYLNAVYFGNGAYGAEAAAQIYFGTSAKKLDTAQAALLVGMLKNPSGYNPIKHPQAATDRRATVLQRMVTTGSLTQNEATTAGRVKLPTTLGTISSGCDKSDYPHFCSLVRSEMLSNVAFGQTAEERAHKLTRGGTTVTTTLDRQAMRAAAQAATNALGTDNRVAAGIATVVPGTGHLAAVAQNHAWDRTQITFATRAFQPGSAMKPVVLAAAMENGIPATTVLNSDGPYRPPGLAWPRNGFTNYGYFQYGNMNGAEALRKSTNVYFIRLIAKTGVIKTADTARRLGIKTIPQNLTGREASLALGGYVVTPIDMANAYSVFAADGIGCDVTTITHMARTSTGEKLKAPDTNCHEVLPAAAADTVGALMAEPFKKGGTLAKVGMPAWPTGAKTGTTNNNTDNWTVGTTRQYASAVWLGDPRGSQAHPLKTVKAYGKTYYNTTGAEVAGPIFKAVIEGTHRGLPKEKMPKANHASSTIHTGKNIPDVRGMSTESALASLESAGATIEIDPQTLESDFKPGTVVSQSPAGGSTWAADTTITLTLTHGSDTNVRIKR